MLLTIQNLDFSYGAVQVLYQVNLDVEVNKITCVMGRNGVGKTTLLRNIMGHLTPAGGRIYFAGENIVNLPPHRRAKMGINLVPQGREIFPSLTVEENLRVGLEARTKIIRKVPDEIYDLFPVLKEMRKRKGGDLSGGQQQQLAIGRALAGDPGCLLLDEPTEGIQPSIIKEIGHVLQRLVVERKMAVVLVEQYVDFVTEIGHHFVIMNRGRIEYSGNTSELANPEVREKLSV